MVTFISSAALIGSTPAIRTIAAILFSSVSNPGAPAPPAFADGAALSTSMGMWCQLRISPGELWVLHAHRARHPLQDPCRSDTPGDLRATEPRRRTDGRGPDGSGRGLATGRLKASRGPKAGRAGARPPRRSPDALLRAARRLGPADRLDKPHGWVLAEPVRTPRRSTQKDGPMTKPA